MSERKRRLETVGGRLDGVISGQLGTGTELLLQTVEKCVLLLLFRSSLLTATHRPLMVRLLREETGYPRQVVFRLGARLPDSLPPINARPERWKNKMTPDELNNIAVELKRLGSELNLSDQQKDQLKTFLADKYEKFQEYKKQNPNVSKEDIAQYLAKNRSAGREKLEKFLTSEQLTKWDAEIAKAKDFLSTRAASA
jgi:periplasmic protein CpxP/Spy